jgi:Glycerate kinase
MGGGLLPFINARIESGRDIIMNIINADDAIKNADIIITGEGKIDRQTIMGKALGGILDKAVEYSKPIIVMAGCVEDAELLNRAGFTSIFSIQPYPIDLEKAMDKEFALQNLERCTVQILRLIISTNSFKNI